MGGFFESFIPEAVAFPASPAFSVMVMLQKPVTEFKFIASDDDDNLKF